MAGWDDITPEDMQAASKRPAWLPYAPQDGGGEFIAAVQSALSEEMDQVRDLGSGASRRSRTARSTGRPTVSPSRMPTPQT
jgi:hypothetical protein